MHFQKTKPRVLTAADFVDAQTELNSRISRCIGHYENEHVATGHCRKFYLRCSIPTISALMCSRPNEVFSEAHKYCVPKGSLAMCEVKRVSSMRTISFNPKKGDDSLEEELPMKDTVFRGDGHKPCVNRPDGFYRDDTDCSRVLQVSI